MKRHLPMFAILAIVVTGFSIITHAAPAKAATTPAKTAAPAAVTITTWHSTIYITTYDNSMCQELWGKINGATRNVTGQNIGEGKWRLTITDDGPLTTLGSYSPGGDCATSYVGAGVHVHWTGGMTVTLRGTLKNPLPTNMTIDYTSDHRQNKYFLAWFNDVSDVQYESWGWDYNTCGNGAWHDNAATESAWKLGNNAMGDIVGAPAACQFTNPAAVEYQPQSCNANSVVLAGLVGRRVRTYLVQASGNQELQYQFLNFVERGLVNGQPSGKVSLVFHPRADSWKEFDGQKLLVRIEGYADAWYWFPQPYPGTKDTLFCGWAPAPGKGFSSKQ